MIQPTSDFKANLALLPSIDGVVRIDLVNTGGAVVDTIENKPGKQGSLAVYQYLAQTFAQLDADAATHALAVFAEHTEDAKNRPGAHPNIDRLLEIAGGSEPLSVKIITA
ncbi:DUF2322 family protein [Donghicola sp. XS_ASV15]|uniref:DUF2322 family protein n=1 Tax=Donghicola sp. XS_ASV15 TaxID=3241295 RepID=UPI003511107C